MEEHGHTREKREEGKRGRDRKGEGRKRAMDRRREKEKRNERLQMTGKSFAFLIPLPPILSQGSALCWATVAALTL